MGSNRTSAIALALAVLAAGLAIAAACWCFPFLGKVVMMKAIWANENEKVMDTYGVVVDQHGDPVAGAKVQMGVGLYVDFTHSGGKRYDAETDAEGKFSFVGIRGAWSGYDFKKEGYTYDIRSPTSSRPKDYTPDPKRPIIFTMWKLKGAEPMTTARISNVIPCDGSATEFNALTGKPVADGGDLVVKLTRDPVNIVSNKPFDWSITLEIPSGGLIETTDAYLNEAPAEGYRPYITYNMPADMAHWSSSLSRAFYLKSRNGQVYGNMKVDIITGGGDPAKTLFGALIFANPAGSRNLEFDLSKRIKTQE